MRGRFGRLWKLRWNWRAVKDGGNQETKARRYRAQSTRPHPDITQFRAAPNAEASAPKRRSGEEQTGKAYQSARPRS